MAFTFTVEDGTGLSNATSYVSVEEADDYFAVDTNAVEAWTALNSSDKEKILSWASRVLDQKCTWRGYRATTTQALRWPRADVRDRDGELIEMDVIPVQLKQATFELAKYLLTNDPTTGRDTDPIRRVEIDAIEIEFQEDSSQSDIPSILNHILAGIGTYRVGGSTFGRILKV